MQGNDFNESRRYKFLEQQSYTKFNTSGWEYNFRFLTELFTGYGLKPQRYIIGLSITLTFFAFFYLILYSFQERLYIQLNFVGLTNFLSYLVKSYSQSAGAFYTFGLLGTKNNLFNDSGICSAFASLLYIVETFFGVILNGLFIATLANYFNYQQR